jgi:hypothetical protein
VNSAEKNPGLPGSKFSGNHFSFLKIDYQARKFLILNKTNGWKELEPVSYLPESSEAFQKYQQQLNQIAT